MDYSRRLGTLWSSDFAKSLKIRMLERKIEFLVLSGTSKFWNQEGTEITLSPPSDPEELRISCQGDKAVRTVCINPTIGVADLEINQSLLFARSFGLLKKWDLETVTHAVADIIGDIIGLGRILADIEVKLGPFYHKTTVGIIREIRKIGEGAK